MPRRGAINEKKREQLMQEHEQLQKLMFQARSSVRRSSMKEHTEEDATHEPEEDATEQISSAAEAEVPFAVQHEASTETKTAGREPLTEKDLFPETPTLQNKEAEVKRPLTENDLFPEPSERYTQPLQRGSTIKVILPNQNTAAPVAVRAVRQAEETERQYMPRAAEREAVQEAHEPELALPEYNEPPTVKTKRSGTRSYIGLLLVVLLIGIGGYYLYSTTQKGNDPVAKQQVPESKPVSQPTAITPTDTAQAQPITEEKNESSQPADTQAKAATVEEEAAPVVNPPAVTENVQEPTTASGETFGRYKVISKAYFHNEPDESTRRKAFIIHWNNAVLTPQDEQNGFVYIVFTNHLGQTSRGWLRKQDLRRID